jgi:hypothetical protein
MIIRTHVASVSLVLLSALAAAAAPESEPGKRGKIVLYVAQNGNDAWSGRLTEPNAAATDGPLATLSRARDVLRRLRAREDRERGATVMVRGGTYHLAQPLLVGPDDSGSAAAPVIYCAYPGEQVTLSGGRPIRNWRKGEGALYVADLDGAQQGNAQFRQLFAAGRRQIRARTPNFDPQNPRTGGWLFVASPEELGLEAAPPARDRFHFRPGELQRWPRSPAPEIHVFPAWGWVNAILSVERIDPDKHVVHVTNRNCTQELRPGNRYFVANVFEALDAPGEWFLDRPAGRVYWWPEGESLVSQGVVAPVLDRILEIAGQPAEEPSPEEDRETKPRWVEHLVFRGFTFRHTRYSLEMPSVYSPNDAAITLARARHCLIEDCRFEGVGGYAVRMSDFCDENHVLHNTVIDAGQGGVLLMGSDSEKQPKRNVIAGNRIERCGGIWKHVAGVYVTTGGDNRIAHNTVTDVPRYGISLKSYGPGAASHGNVVEYNRLVRTNLETNDTGAIETLGRDREDTGNVIRGNLILDSVGLKTTESGEMLTPYYTWGIYLDDYSSGTTVVDNVVARTFRGSLHVHLGRNNVFENNVLVDGHEQQLECNGREFMRNNRFAGNIVYFHQGNLIRIRAWDENVLSRCDRNLYWQVGRDLAQVDEPVTPLGPLAKWQAAGFDRHSLVADPLFVDPQHDDYRLRPESPAFQLGFKPIDLSKTGTAGYTRPAALP